jgi:hypothetical protein
MQPSVFLDQGRRFGLLDSADDRVQRFRLQMRVQPGKRGAQASGEDDLAVIFPLGRGTLG